MKVRQIKAIEIQLNQTEASILKSFLRINETRNIYRPAVEDLLSRLIQELDSLNVESQKLYP